MKKIITLLLMAVVSAACSDSADPIDDYFGGTAIRTYPIENRITTIPALYGSTAGKAWFSEDPKEGVFKWTARETFDTMFVFNSGKIRINPAMQKPVLIRTGKSDYLAQYGPIAYFISEGTELRRSFPADSPDDLIVFPARVGYAVQYREDNTLRTRFFSPEGNWLDIDWNPETYNQLEGITYQDFKFEDENWFVRILFGNDETICQKLNHFGGKYWEIEFDNAPKVEIDPATGLSKTKITIETGEVEEMIVVFYLIYEYEDGAINFYRFSVDLEAGSDRAIY